MLTEKKNIFSHGLAQLKNTGFLKKVLNFRNRKRFSTYLVTTFVVLATLSVLVILVALYGYFGKEVESEFRKKILAEKGQVEIILNNRISSISGMLKDLGSDNIIRVTVMLDGQSQLKDRVSEFYPSREGVYFFVKKQGEKYIIPYSYPNLNQELILFAQESYPYGEVVEDDGNTRLLWWFSTPIMHQTQLMGTAYVLYDMTQDQKLIETVNQTFSVSDRHSIPAGLNMRTTIRITKAKRSS